MGKNSFCFIPDSCPQYAGMLKQPENDRKCEIGSILARTGPQLLGPWDLRCLGHEVRGPEAGGLIA